MVETPIKNELIIKNPEAEVNHVPYTPPRKVGIVIPVLNYFVGLADLLISIKTRHEYAVYVQPQYIFQKPLAKVWNDGAQQAFDDGCDYAIVCNDDILFAPDCIDQLVKVYEELRESENVIMVTPNNILGQVNNDKYAILHHPPHEGAFTWSDHPNFSCFLISPEYFELVGKFDENFVPAWYEDNDSHRRATLLGLREVCTTAANSVHLGGTTTKMMDNPSSGVSQAYYIEKWGGLPATHMNDLPKEHFPTPYNDPTLTVRDWRGQA